MRNLQRPNPITRPAVFCLLMSGLLALTGVAAAEGGEANIPPAAPARLSETLGHISAVQADSPRVVIRDVEIPIDYEMVEGERIVLSTVGVEHPGESGSEFHPLVSVLIDRTFPEAPDGEWLAIWNLGHKSPGLLSHVRATIPGWTATKRTQEREFRGVERKLEDFERKYEEGKISFPEPLYTLHQKHDRSTGFLVANAIKNIFNFTKVPYPAVLLLRTYLIQRKDLQEREFEQAYLGLTWYSDLALSSPDGETLSPEAIEMLKFRLLTNRHLLGRWTDPRASENFVHAFESQMRDHLWGTSCYLASEANEYHLGYEEIHRYTAGGVPLALGGLLYYDPELAPEPEQVRWSKFNPFDLSYNPFTDEEVLKAAESGRRVPLAIYVYQSNTALKPIITVDFFRPNNPRIREATTYWRKVGNEALSAWGGFGYFYTWLRRGVSFLANRKGLSYFTDRMYAFGIEELRLSLMSHLYFDPEASDQLVDRVDRLIINPLVQPARLHGIRSELHLKSLLAEDGRKLVSLARWVRGRSVREALGKEGGTRLMPADYDLYRQHLAKDIHVRRLELVMSETQVPSLTLEKVLDSVDALGKLADGRDQTSAEVLMRFWADLQGDARVLRAFGENTEMPARSLLGATSVSLRNIYAKAGKSDQELESDFQQVLVEQARIRAREEREWEKEHAEEFAEELRVRVAYLKDFLQSEADLNRYSPWYVAEALEFLRHVPEMIEVNPRAEAEFQKRENEVEQLLLLAERRLSEENTPLRAEWLEEERLYCLDSARRVRRTLAEARAEEVPGRDSVEVDGSKNVLGRP